MTTPKSPPQPEVPVQDRSGDRHIGTTIGHCVLEAGIGRGGMGTVYLAKHTTLQKKVAVKVLRQDLPTSAQGIDRLLREARAAAQLDHPNIVPVYDAGQENGLYYIVMQYVPGESLARRLGRERALPMAEALRIFKAMAQGLAHAHAHGIIHRDIKPDNILLGEDGSVKIGDFGLARALQGEAGLSSTGMILGSPNFMSPEQALGEKVDQRTDIYSLGSTLYQMISGSPPFEADSVLGVVYKVVKEPLRPPRAANPRVPQIFSRFVCILMRKDKARRPATVGQVLSLLQQAEKVESQSRERSPLRGKLVAAACFLVLLGLLATGILLSPWTLPWAHSRGSGDEKSPVPAATGAGKIAEASERPGKFPGPSKSAEPAKAASAAEELSAPEMATLISRFEELKAVLAGPEPRLAPFIDPDLGGMFRQRKTQRRPAWVQEILGQLSSFGVRNSKTVSAAWHDPGRKIARLEASVPGKDRLFPLFWVLRGDTWYLTPRPVE